MSNNNNSKTEQGTDQNLTTIFGYGDNLPLNTYPTTPQEEFQQLTNQLVNNAKQHKLETEVSAQNDLNKASNTVDDSNKIEQIYQELNQIQQELSNQGVLTDPAKYQEAILSVEEKVNDQLHQTDKQVQQNLQQSVSSMAEAQSSLMDSNTLESMLTEIKRCKKAFTVWNKNQK